MMTDKELSEIKKRLHGWQTGSAHHAWLGDDACELLKEVERLRKENEKLQQDVSFWKHVREQQDRMYLTAYMVGLRHAGTGEQPAQTASEVDKLKDALVTNSPKKENV